MITKPLWPDKDWFFGVRLYNDGAQEPCPLCSVVGIRIIEQWSERQDLKRPGWGLTRQTMMPCHCVVVSTKGLGGCGERADIPYPPDEPEEG